MSSLCLRFVFALSSIAIISASQTQFVAAAPTGTTTTLEITLGASALYYGSAVATQNKKSKGARNEAEQSFARLDLLADKSNKIIAYTSFPNVRAKAPTLSLHDIRAYILEAVANDPTMKLTKIPAQIDATDPGAIRRNAFEILRGCWNAFAIAPASAPSAAEGAAKSANAKGNAATPKKANAESSNKTSPTEPHKNRKPVKPAATLTVSYDRVGTTLAAADPPVPEPTPYPENSLSGKGDKLDCLQPLSGFGDPTTAELTKDIIGPNGIDIDLIDAGTAFSSAPSLVAQVSSQQVGGNAVENQLRASVIAVLSLLFLDLFPPTNKHFHNLEIVDKSGNVLIAPTSTTLAGPAATGSSDPASALTTFGTSCLFGTPTIAGCEGSLNSLESQAVSGIGAADACAFGRYSFIPSYSRIARHPDTGSGAVHWNDLDYGQPPGC